MKNISLIIIKYTVILLLTTVLASFSLAQNQLFVNGHRANAVFNNGNEIFVLLKDFAQLLNAKYAFDNESGVFSLDYDGHILLARADTGLATIDNSTFNLAMTEVDSKLFASAKELAKIFGASYGVAADIAYLIFPRASLLSFKLQSFGDYDRVVLEFEGLSSAKELFDDELNTLNVVFDNVVEQSKEISYGQRAVLELGSSKGYLLLKLILAQDSSYSSYFEASNNGFKMIIDVFETRTLEQNSNRELCLISTLAIAEELKREFEHESIDLRIFETQKDADKLLQHDLCFALSTGDLPRSQVKIFYKDGNKADFVIQENAAKAIGFNNNPNRQKVLEKLASNYAFGQALALRIADYIYQTMGYRAAVIAEDIDLLKKFSGKAVYIEISEEDSTNLLLMQAISQSIISFVKPND